MGHGGAHTMEPRRPSPRARFDRPADREHADWTQFDERWSSRGEAGRAGGPDRAVHHGRCPDEPLPQLGAARVYLATDSWQSKVIDLMDRAQLIVMAAGATRSVQWELDTVLSRDAWSKLVVLMPASTQEDHATRWGAIVAALQDESWHDALAGLDPREVIAMRLLDGGEISAVTSDRRLTVDYVLAMRVMLHQMQDAIAT